MSRVVLGCAVFALAAACGGDFDPGSRVSKLRVLAVQSDRPFARPGEEVSLGTLAFDPEGRALTYGFALCRNPKTSSVLECLGGADPAPLAIGPDGNLRLTVPEVSTLGVVVAACPGALRYQGGPLPFVCDVGGRALPLESFELGVKRIFLRSRDRNENPRIDGVSWDGAPWPENETREATRCGEDTNAFDECPEKLAHRIDVAASPPEAGRDETGADFRERQVVQYYASEGIFEFEMRTTDSPTTRWLPRRSSPGEVRMWIVVRDDRGGVTWTERRMTIR